MQYFLALAQAEGWNPGLCDALPYYHSDPDGYFIGKLDGKRVGCISCHCLQSRRGKQFILLKDTTFKRNLKQRNVMYKGIRPFNN